MGKTATLKKSAATKRAHGSRSIKPVKFSARALQGIAQLHDRGKSRGGSSLTVTRFKGMVKDLDVGMPIWSGALHMSAVTLEHRLKEKIAFHPLEEDRLFAVQQVLERGMEVFEDTGDLVDWLKDKHALLQNQRPMDLLGSTAGIGLLMMELGRIEHGVY